MSSESTSPARTKAAAMMPTVRVASANEVLRIPTKGCVAGAARTAGDAVQAEDCIASAIWLALALASPASSRELAV